MYYHIGAHPGFMCPVNNGENIENCILRFEKEAEKIEASKRDQNSIRIHSRMDWNRN